MRLTTNVDLRSVLDICQGDDAEDWITIPGGGPGDRFIVVLVDVASNQEPPALAALHHYYRAVYLPDARLGVAWGMTDEDWREPDESRENPPEWIPKEWSSVRPRYAHVLLNGAMVWQVRYAAVNWGAGISGVLPWPRAQFTDRQVTDPPEVASWRTTNWEVRFARLLNELQRNDQFQFDRELASAGMQPLDIHPIDAEREGL